MGSVIKKEIIYQILFFACIGVPYLSIYELTFAVWSITAMVTLRNTYSFNILRHLACFTAIFIIALLVSFTKDVATYKFLRDVAYMLKPIIGLLVGYQLCKNYIKKPLVFIVNTGIIIAVIHLLVIGYSIAVYKITDMHKLREYSGYFSDFEVYAIIVLVFHKKLGIEVSSKKYQVGILLLGISIFLYLARTNFIQFIIFYMAMRGYFIINKRSVIVVSTLVLTVLVGYAAIYTYNPRRGSNGFEAFLYKIKIAPIEPFKTRVNSEDWRDFNDNYRSYETILTLNQVPNGGPLAVAFGEGMGSSVDLKREVWLQTSFMRYIPFLHNGFMTIFLKSGVLGDILLVVSILLFFRNRKSANPQVRQLNYLMVGTGIFLIMSYYVFMGLYFVPDSKSIVIGFLIRYRDNLYLLQKNDITA
jgi:hypothetical protein